MELTTLDMGSTVCTPIAPNNSSLTISKQIVSPAHFSVYAHMEELHDDSLYFFKKSELIEKVNFEKILNSAHDEDSTEER